MISAGILPSGFCLRIVSLTSVGSDFSTVTSFSRPRMPSASFTLRPNGEGGEERRIIMSKNPSKNLSKNPRVRRAGARLVSGDKDRSAGDDEIHGLRTLALLVGLDVE